MKKTYAEKLKDPRWQKKRLEVFACAGWKCEFCHDSKSTLHVHHLGYIGDPWDAPDHLLECLCEAHHDARHAGRGCIGAIQFGDDLTAREARFMQKYLMYVGRRAKAKVLARRKAK